MHREANGAATHAVCGLASLAVAVVTLAAGWSVVLAATAWTPLLSTTALVLVTMFVWALVWVGVESALVTLRAVGGRKSVR